MSNQPYSFTYQGSPERLDRVVVSELARVENHITRSQLEKLIEGGGVSIDSKICLRPGVKISEGQKIEITLAQPASTHLTPYNFTLDIVYEDSDLLVINKPARISMHPGAGERTATLANAVVHHVGSKQRSIGESDRPGIVHRLDRDTTGLVVVAKTAQAHANLAAQFAARSIDRKYLALVFTTPRARRAVQQNETGEISAALGRDLKDRKRICVIPEADQRKAKSAVTKWKVVERFNYGTLVECTLATGRTHQIRVHMDHIDSPVVGDKVYGDFSNLPRDLHEASRLFGRQALHAAMLGFDHPTSKERVVFEAEVPEDMGRLLELFRAEN